MAMQASASRFSRGSKRFCIGFSSVILRTSSLSRLSSESESTRSFSHDSHLSRLSRESGLTRVGSLKALGFITRTFTQQAEKIGIDSYSQLCVELDEKPEQAVELLDQWRAQEGNQLTVDRFTEIFENFARHRQRRAALKLMAHVRNNNIVPLTTEHFIRELGVASFEYGPTGPQRSYEQIPAEFKTEKVTAALVSNLIKSKALLKADAWAKKLPKKPKTAEVFNVLISLYFAREMHEHVIATYARLKKAGFEPTVESYLLLLKCKKRVGGLEGIEEEAREALKKIAIDTGTDRLDLSFMMDAYAQLGEADQVDKIWKTLCTSPSPPLESYKCALDAFGVLGQVEKAEQVAEEMLQNKRSIRSPYFDLIDMYVRLGMVDKAKKVVEEKVDESKCFCNALILHHLEMKETDKALELTKKNPSLVSLASYETVLALLSVFAERKEVKSARWIVSHYLASRHGDVRIYNKLLKVYIAAGMKPDRLLKEEFAYLVPNEKTLLLLLECES